MTLTIYILIAISVCIPAIVLWTDLGHRKYKREYHLIILLLVLCPALSHAQYIDNERCRISFKSHENQQGKLESVKDDVLYQFIPSSSAWKVIVKNNTNEDVWINWNKAGFIVNGRASGVSLYPFTTDSVRMEAVKNNTEISRTITASNLITEKRIDKIYNKKNLRKGGRTSVTIVLPMIIGTKPQFFHIFNFIITQAD